MKQNYFKTKSLLVIIMALIISGVSYSQDIHFTFANAQNTNDGVDDFYEVDVMIQTINSTGTFKLGSGQLYFTYNTAAFGTNVLTSGGITVTQPDGYICGQGIDVVPTIKIYGSFTTNDNTTSRVSWSFSQIFSSSTFAADNVIDTPAMLSHIKVKYTDVNQDPMFMLESGATFADQFFTACGPAGGGATDVADCGGEPGTQLVNDTFDSAGATLSNKDFELSTGISLYPNPAKDILYIKGDVSNVKSIEVYSVIGQSVMQIKKSFKEINLSNLQSGLYLIKLNTDETSGVYRIIKE